MHDQSRKYVLDKRDISRSFSFAAQNYQLVNQLQQTVADRLLDRLGYINIEPRVVLDLGSGPGTSSSKLARRYRKANIIETDISLSMLREARRQAPRFFSRRKQACSDAEKLGFESGSFDLVFSSLMMQWCDDIDLVLQEAGRVLRPNGLFIFSTFGPDTLVELRQSWQEVDEDIHVNAFIDMHDIGDALIRLGMESPVMETEKIVLNYKSVQDLMRELKLLGAHNVNNGRRRTLTGKNRMQKMFSHYEKSRNQEGRLPATYEVIYGHAWLPATVQAKRLDEQTMVFPISALKSNRN